jgi:hypothetical protein
MRQWGIDEIEAGQNIKCVRNQPGQTSIQVTMNIYGHLMKPVNSEEAEKLFPIRFIFKIHAKIHHHSPTPPSRTIFT